MSAQSFSDRVLQRRRTRRAHRISFAVLIAMPLLMLALVSVSVVGARKIEAPTWADFKMAGAIPGFEERVSPVSPDGVPNSIAVNGEQWSIVLVNHFGDTDEHHVGTTMAQTYCQERTIAYIRDEDGQRLKRSLMHEVFHAGACLHGGDAWWNSVEPTDHDHPGIYHLGEFVATFMRDNPRFVAWEAQ